MDTTSPIVIPSVSELRERLSAAVAEARELRRLLRLARAAENAEAARRARTDPNKGQEGARAN
jgi:hypothetical protein